MATNVKLQKQVTELEAAQARAEVVYQISRDLNEARDETELLQVLARSATQDVETEMALFYVDLDEAGEPEWIEKVAGWHPKGELRSPIGTSYLVSQFPFIRPLLSGDEATLLIADTRTEDGLDENTRALTDRLAIRAIALIRLVHAGRWVGFAMLEWSDLHEFSEEEVESYRAFASLVPPIAENRRLLAQTQAALNQSKAMYEISRDLNAAGDENELLQVLARSATGDGSVEMVLFYIDLDEAGKPAWMEKVAGWQQEGEQRSSVGSRYSISQFPIMDLVLSGQEEMLIIADTDTDERLESNTKAFVDQLHIRAMALIPLIHAGQWVGFAMLEWGEPRKFSEREVEIYRAFANLVPSVVANRRLLVEKQTERVRLQQDVIEAQKQAIQELSTPVIPIMERIIVMPLIGSIDTLRAKDITRGLLAGIRAHRAKVVILDITGVPIVDSGVADHLNKTIQAARLKGARTIVTGISDAVAETIVDLGIDWSSIETLSDLQTGLVVALSSLGVKLTR
ncbi:MAG: GAF domain-containing protein [Chloroflexota bacterium]|nr:GAF domain-containing protein [Chloroflexota bacterium]